MTYSLPSHPGLSCQDPLGLCSNDDGAAAVWDVVKAAIASASNPAEGESTVTLPDLIESLVYSLHGTGTLQANGLRNFLKKNLTQSQYDGICSNIFAAALSLPELFPSHTIPYLAEQNHRISLSYQQINAILAHQLLGTLAPPPGGWGPPTFVCWYNENNPHPMAVEGYLTTLFDHFSNPLSPPFSHIQFYLCQASEQGDDDIWSNCDLPIHISLALIDEEREPSDALVQPPPAVVIPSNRQPGFGPAGTHEERLFSSSLFLCPIVIFCPSLPPNAALITSPIPVHAAWKGHNRSARLTSLFPRSSRPKRTYVLMDALELDVHDHSRPGLSDLAPGNVERELRKVYAGCTGLRTMYPGHTPGLECGAWGCGAFGGNAVVKGVVLAMASTRAGVQLRLALCADRRHESELIRKVVDAGLTVRQVLMASTSEAAQQCRDGEAFVRLLLAE